MSDTNPQVAFRDQGEVSLHGRCSLPHEQTLLSYNFRFITYQLAHISRVRVMGLWTPISPLQQAQIVIVENKQFIEAVINILQCPCAEKGCTMITLRILEQYRAAAQIHSVQGKPTPYRETPSHDKRQRSSPSGSGDTNCGKKKR
jgi:hypothetical protein